MKKRKGNVMTGAALLLSIQPRYAEKIFSGNKSVELRRVRPRVGAGDLVLVYVSTPVKALLGAFKVKSVISAEPTRLWRLIGRESGISKIEFLKYFVGAETGYGIRLKEAWHLSAPIELATLRKAWSRFRPPQSYQYLSDLEVHRIAGGVPHVLGMKSSRRLARSN